MGQNNENGQRMVSIASGHISPSLELTVVTISNQILDFRLVATSRTPGSAPIPTHLGMLTWETGLYSPIMRKLVNESAHAFTQAQKAAKEQQGKISD